ncbi:MAG: hypothetical protein JW888_02160 [Pirellulales bacterium]|nr:hypothetical protein [Pirellulales bacterium]
MTDEIKPTLDLFTRFREATGGDGLATAFLTLAHLMLEHQEEPAEPPIPKSPPNRLLSLKEAADYLGYTVNGLRKLVDRARASHRGKYTEGPTIQLFQSTNHAPIRFKREWLDEFVKDHRIEAKHIKPVPTVRKRGRPSTIPPSHRDGFSD